MTPAPAGVTLAADTLMTTTIQQNIDILNQRLREYEIRYNRTPNTVALLAVSKAHNTDEIKQAIAAGQYAFGENYLQEALTKISALNDPTLEWHFIGPIQSNKTRKIAENFTWVHSLCDLKIAERLSRQRPTHLPPLNICLQVNISQALNQSGIASDELLALATACRHLPQLVLRGLMMIGGAHKTVTEQRIGFAKLRTLFDQLQEKGFSLDTLSMGMSDDLEAAVAEGSTLVRIGTKIFGYR